MGCGSSQPVHHHSTGNNNVAGAAAATTATTTMSSSTGAAAGVTAAGGGGGGGASAANDTNSRRQQQQQQQLQYVDGGGGGGIEIDLRSASSPTNATTTTTKNTLTVIDGPTMMMSTNVGTTTTVATGDAGSVVSANTNNTAKNSKKLRLTTSSSSSSSPLKLRGLSKRQQQKGKGGELSPTTVTSNTTPGSTTRIRADTWETTLTDDLQQQQQQRLYGTDDDDNDDDDNNNDDDDMEYTADENNKKGVRKGRRINHNNNNGNNHKNENVGSDNTKLLHLNPLYNDIPSIGGVSSSNNRSTHNSNNSSSSQPRVVAEQQQEQLSSSKTTNTNNNSSSSKIGPIQEQWCTIWDQNIRYIVNPQDIISVLYTLINSYIDRLSNVQLLCIRKSIQLIVQRYLPPTTNIHAFSTTTTGNLPQQQHHHTSVTMATTPSSNGVTAANNNHHHQNTIMNGYHSSKENTTTTNKIVAKVFSSAAGTTNTNNHHTNSNSNNGIYNNGNHNNNNNSNNNNNNNKNTAIVITPAERILYNESRQILDKYQLLNKTILLKLLPKGITTTTTTTTTNIHQQVQESIVVLLLSVGDCYTHTNTSIGLQRFLTAAQQAITICQINMDNNNTTTMTTTTTTTTVADPPSPPSSTTTSATTTATTNIKMPKPSQIPVYIDEQPMIDLPIGTSFGSLSSIIAMACCDCIATTTTTKSAKSATTTTTTTAISKSIVYQKLHLLFYICIEPNVLQNFILLHPAGGIPIWLYEIYNHTVLSLPSLTHYHYYGNTFLPSSSSSSSSTSTSTTNFIPSKSRTPLHVDAMNVQNLIRQILQHCIVQEQMKQNLATTTTASTADSTSTTTTTTPVLVTEKASSSTQEGRRNSFTVPTFGRRTTSTENMTTAAASGHNNNNTDAMSPNSNHDTTIPTTSQQQPTNTTMNGTNGTNSSTNNHRGSKLMKKLFSVANGTEIDTYYNYNTCNTTKATTSSTTELEDLLFQYNDANTKFLEQYDVTEWNIQEFKNWCDAVLLLGNNQNGSDVRILQLVMHHLFGYGILPSPMMEYELVLEQWYEWEKEYYQYMEQQSGNNNESNDGQSIAKMFTDSVSVLMGSPPSQSNGSSSGTKNRLRLGAVFGGVGGIDGLGGLGHGVMYCIPKRWWDQWTEYVNWSFTDETTNLRLKKQYTAQRPSSLQTESLLQSYPDKITRGILGSYELMKENLQCNVDYVLVPPGVWDVLYEIYSGGPPLPRMVKPKGVASSFISLISTSSTVKPVSYTDNILEGIKFPRVMRLPSTLSVETHPYVLHAHICDPLQPYRRGDTGPTSIRIMASPKQPAWRLLSEIICRFSFQTYRAFDSDMRGRVRLWKKIESTTKDTPIPRYGPWNLLCKSRYAILPHIANGLEFNGNIDEVITNWKVYGDDATIESVGLEDQSSLMVEFAVLNRNGELAWPREAAAEAGKVRRLAEEDKQFRQLLLGIDDDGKKLPNPPSLVGMDVDAMEYSGKWYTVKILEVQLVEVVAEEEDDAGIETEVSDTPRKILKKKVRVSFRDHGGHMDWIDVDSDRLQTPGRFASEANLQSPESPTSTTTTTTANGDGRTKSGIGAKRSNSAAENSNIDNTKICILPSFGACGLSNLGNSCYMNSAIQCMAYLPLLRAYLLGAMYKANSDLNNDNPLGTGGRLLEEFADLLRAMWSAKFAEKTPTRFRTHLGKSNEQFACADQQDAQEFLNYMIDVLHEDSNRVRKKPYVEALEDGWVEQTPLSRVGDESWRRFLRRNQSIMADVAMGQALNTVTCPVCNYSSRNFDPFNLLSIPIPTVGDAVFQCTVIRRSTEKNCSGILNKARKGDTRSTTRFPPNKADQDISEPPSDTFCTEQYVISLSRLADSGDLRRQIEKLSGIPADHVRLCRAESILINNKLDDGAATKRYMKIIPLTDREGPAKYLLKPRQLNDETPRMPTHIIAFETTLRSRPMPAKEKSEAFDTDNDIAEENEHAVSKSETGQIERYLSVYGDETECRQVDTDPSVLARAISKSLWPRTDTEFHIGLRVDAKDHRGDWYVGSIVDVMDDTAVSGGDSDTGEEVTIQQKKVRVHFDNWTLAPKRDEYYTIEHFKKGRVFPLYSYAIPRSEKTEFIVHHRYTDRTANQSFLFGQSFYVQCHVEWSNARACAHIIAQASRFLQYNGKEAETIHLFEKVHTSVSDLIDYLIDCDREYVRRALGVSEQSEEEAKQAPYRNPTFASTAFVAETSKRLTTLLLRLPFELRLCSVEPTHGTGANEVSFPLAFNKTVGNFIGNRNSVIIHWREPTTEKKTASQRMGIPSIMYMEPRIHMHESTAALKKSSTDLSKDGRPSKNEKNDDSEVDLEYCLTEFCKVQKLPMSDNWKCPRCQEIREGGQNMNLWRVPDLLTFHLKRFNMSARWHEKVLTKVNFPMTGLDMSQWCHKDSPVLHDANKESCIYDLIGVMNHYGSLTGGHYVATCKATICGRDGKEDVTYNFNGNGINEIETDASILYDDPPVPTSGWSLGRGTAKPKINPGRVDASIHSQAVSHSSESMWLQFDDEVVEIVPPRNVVSEMAYVLFYRKRQITPSNVAKYTFLE